MARTDKRTGRAKYSLTAAALPDVMALARRARPHDCGVWLGLDPDE